MYGLGWMTMFELLHEWKNPVIDANPYIDLFLTRYKTIMDRSFCHCRQGRSFLT